MYIPSNLYKIPVNPNVVSGADFDNNYSNYVMQNSGSIVGTQGTPYKFILPSVEDMIDVDDDELTRIHKKIVQDKAEVVIGQKAFDIVRQKLKDLEPFLSTYSKEYGRLVALKQRGVITEPRELAELDVKIAHEKRQKDSVRLRYSQLNNEASKLDTFINSRKHGSVYGLPQEFEAKAGRPYVPEDFEEQPVIIDQPAIVSNTTVGEEIENLNKPKDVGGVFLPDGVQNTTVGTELPIFDVGPMKGLEKETIIDKISNTVGVSKQNTKYGLIGLGVLAIVMIAKNR
jgi:hypothetical protein